MRKYYLTIVLSILLLTGSFAQNGTRLIGYDAVTSGRGGTTTGFFDNSSLMMNNPAGLSFIKSSRLDLSVSVMAPKLTFKNTINNTNGKNNYFPLGSIGFVKKQSSALTYAFGVFTQGGMGADFNLNHELYKNATGSYVPQPYHSKFAVMQGGGSIAYKLNKYFSAGATLNLIYSQVEFKMPMGMPPSMLKGVIDPQTGFSFGDMFAASPEVGGLGYTEVIASADMNKLTSFGLSGMIGIAYKPNENFSAGINYTLPANLTYKNGKAAMDMNYQLNNAFGKLVAGIMQQNPGATPEEAQQMAMAMFSQLGIDLSKGAMDNYDAKVNLGLPQSISAGLSFAASKKLRLALDAEWINWAHAFKQMDISLTGGINPNINRMMATEGTINMAFPMKWKNTIVIRTGAEFAASKKLLLRGGYVYGSNPVPASTLFPVFPAIVKHHLTAGCSLMLTNSFTLNAAYERAIKDSETAASNSLVAKEYNNSVSSLANNIFHVSVSWLFK